MRFKQAGQRGNGAELLINLHKNIIKYLKSFKH